MTDSFCSDKLEAFFPENMPSVDLFHDGFRNILDDNFKYFDQPIKLPILRPQSSWEFNLKWNVLTSLLRPGDLIATIDRQSRISRMIAYVDSGSWSHICIHAGDGTVVEALTTGVTERDLNTYHDERYRLGVYRHTQIPEDQVGKVIEFARSQIGKPYNYLGVMKLGVAKLLGMRLKSARQSVSPNDICRSDILRLIHVV